MFYRQTSGHMTHSQMLVIKCLTVTTLAKWHTAKWLSNDWQTDDTSYTAKWLSNVWWTDTQTNSYQIFDCQTPSQMVIECSMDKLWPHDMQPNGYQKMFDRQTTLAKWHTAKWLLSLTPDRWHIICSQMVIECWRDRHTVACCGCDSNHHTSCSWL